eukprot:gb/GECG01004648.1/.p1 GENE.gb/GECG01004648.1/~~gb/GECG01004648.1/.p1  ORF type:complete len:562 (+),score=68.30 gb/GECG01004648.1/:1-1686(+)
MKGKQAQALRAVSAWENFNEDATRNVVKNFQDAGIDASFCFAPPDKSPSSETRQEYEDGQHSAARVIQDVMGMNERGVPVCHLHKHAFCSASTNQPTGDRYAYNHLDTKNRTFSKKDGQPAKCNGRVADKSGDISESTNFVPSRAQPRHDELPSKWDSGDPIIRYDKRHEDAGNPVDDESAAVSSSVRAFLASGVKLNWSLSDPYQGFPSDSNEKLDNATSQNTDGEFKQERRLMAKLNIDALKAARGCSAVVRSATTKRTEQTPPNTSEPGADTTPVINRLVELRDSLREYVEEMAPFEDGSTDPGFDEALEKFQQRLESDILAATGKHGGPGTFNEELKAAGFLQAKSPREVANENAAKRTLWHTGASWSFEDTEPLGPTSGNESGQSTLTRNPSVRKNGASDKYSDPSDKRITSSRYRFPSSQRSKHDTFSSDVSISTLETDKKADESLQRREDSRHMGARLTRSSLSHYEVWWDSHNSTFHEASCLSEYPSSEHAPYMPLVGLMTQPEGSTQHNAGTGCYRRPSFTSSISSTGYASDTEDADLTPRFRERSVNNSDY